MELVRTEPRDLAPVIALPVRFEGNRVIEPLDVPTGTHVTDLPRRAAGERAPGRLVRALMALDTAGTR